MPKESLDVRYTTALGNHPEGHALYSPPSAALLTPGTLGYFDGSSWMHLLDLTDRNTLRQHSWGAPHGDVGVKTDPGTLTWGPKRSEHVTAYDVGGSVGAGFGALPVNVNVGGTMAFKNGVEFGAVLATEPPVVCQRSGEAGAYLDWMKRHADRVMGTYGDVVREHGVWIIMRTYATRRCAIALLQSRNEEIKMSVDVEAADVATLTPSVAWWKQQKDSAWATYENADGVVVFVSGIWFRQRRFLKSQLKPEVDRSAQKMYRGGNDKLDTSSSVFTREEPEGVIMELQPHPYGLDLTQDENESNSDQDSD